MKLTLSVLLSTLALSMIAPYVSAQDVALGEAFIVDETWSSIQQTSSVGKMIARDSNGGIHLTWTWSPSADGGTRRVKYAFADDAAGDLVDQFAYASIADVENRAGYSSLDLWQTNDGAVAALFFHGSSKGIAAFDFAPGFGAFGSIYFDPPGDIIPINSKGCIGREGRMFLAAGVHNPMAGDPNFVLTVWPADPVGDDRWQVGVRTEVELTTGLSHVLTASRTTDRVAVLWHHNLIGVPADEDWAGRLEHHMNNDIYAVIAADGRNLDWDNPVNVTNTILPDVEREGIAALGDTLRPYPDMDAIWVGDVLHVVFTSRGFWADLAEEMVPPVERLTVAESFIWHWDSETDTLTLVADGWFENDIDAGGFTSNVCKPSLGADADGKLYCVFQKASLAEDNEDGYVYGDVWVAFSEDGSEWSEAVNLTDTQPQNNQQIEYIHETYPSLAERVDENLHISYLLQSEPTDMEGQRLVGKAIYQRVAIGDLGDYVPLELPRERFGYHNTGELAVIDDKTVSPNNFELTSVFPNPFNGTTQISFTVKSAGDARLEITDITGRLVAVLVQGIVEAGSNRVEWDAEFEQSGVYLVRLTTAEGQSTTQKVVLLR